MKVCHARRITSVQHGGKRESLLVLQPSTTTLGVFLSSKRTKFFGSAIDALAGALSKPLVLHSYDEGPIAQQIPWPLEVDVVNRRYFPLN